MKRRDYAGESTDWSRRRFLGTAGVSALGITTLAGCLGDGSGDGTTTNTTETDEPVGQIGSGRSPFGDRDISGGVSMREMPDLSGELTVYSGRGQALVGELVEYINGLYDDLDLKVRYGGSTDLVNQIITEGQQSPADVFYSVNAGALGALAERGRTNALPSEVQSMVRDEFQNPDGQWTGVSGRARTIPFNTNEFSESDIPDDIFAFPEQSSFENALGWAPSYGSFQAFVTAMRVLNGEQKTRQWLEDMQALGTKTYSDEFLVSQAVAEGEIQAGFANHYYIQRVLAGNPNASISTAFTNNDAGTVFNVAGAAVVNTTDAGDTAANFVRHLLSAEAQDYFARTTFEYPLVPEIEPIGRLPTIDQLNPPELDLAELSDLEPTVKLLRETGLL